jgi:hypothetical protein
MGGSPGKDAQQSPNTWHDLIRNAPRILVRDAAATHRRKRSRVSYSAESAGGLNRRDGPITQAPSVRLILIRAGCASMRRCLAATTTRANASSLPTGRETFRSFGSTCATATRDIREEL